MSIPDRDSVLEAAHEYARRGWRVLPLHAVTEDGRCSCGRERCNSEGKHPVLGGWQNSPLLSGADIQATFEGEEHNVGLATGTPSGFWVLDIDLDKPGTQERLKELFGGKPKVRASRIVKTPGGWHYYFAMPDFQVTNSAKRLPDGVDVRGTGGQVVAPPSTSAKGVYTVFLDDEIRRAPEWLEDMVRPLPAPDPIDLATLPKITDLPGHEQSRLRTYTDRAAERELSRFSECMMKGWSGPGWNDTVFEVSCTLLELANSPWCPLTPEAARAMVLERAPRDNAFGDAEIQGCFASALKKVAGKGREMPAGQPSDITVIPGDPLTDPSVEVPTVAAPTGGGTLRLQTDLGNADRMVDLYSDRLRFIGENDRWVEYIDGAWRTMYKDRGTFFAQEMIRNLVATEAENYSDIPEEEGKPSDREKFVKWAVSCQSDTRINACIRQARARPQLAAKIEDFDSDPDVLNVANGIVDLRTGELLPHTPDRLMMLQSPVSYDADAPCPLWEKFLDRVQPDPEVQQYLQRALGYSLTGSMAEQALFIHHGTGANGKSVFLVVASLLAGDYGQSVPRETLLSRSNGQTEHPTSVARMRGKRFLQASETAAGRRLDEETVKGLTGGEQQSARYMGKDFFDFTPTGKIHLITNHLPRLTDAESIWRRLHLVKWGVRIPEDEKNPDMLRPDYWAEEASGLLAWAVRGAVEWYQHGLKVPESMRRALLDYRTDQDILGEFIEDRLIDNGLAFTSTQDIWNAYSAWCFNHGIKNVMNAHDLGRALKERGFTPKRTASARGFALHIVPTRLLDIDPLVTSK